MPNSTAALKAQFDFQTRLFNNVLEGITDSESSARDHGQVNHIKWIAGHILNTRVNSMSKLAGLQPDESYSAHFARGTALGPDEHYPPIEEITAKWRSTASAIGEGITKIPEEKLAAKSNAQVPIADDTVLGLLAFFLSHEALHIGQLSLLRKIIGKEAMSFK